MRLKNAREIEIAAFSAAIAVIAFCGSVLMAMFYGGILYEFAALVPGFKPIVEFGLIATPAVIPGLIVYFMVYAGAKVLKTK